VAVTERIPDPLVLGIPVTTTVLPDCVASRPGGRLDAIVILDDRFVE
jgi:hypothetical protein